LDLATNPMPTVTWAPVPGAALHRLRVRPLNGPDAFNYPQPSGPSVTLPAGVMSPGRVYIVAVDGETSASGLPQTNARSQREIRVITRGPELTLSGSGSTATGETFTVSARARNTGPALQANAIGWLGRPDGTIDVLFSVDDVTIPDSTNFPNTDF